MGLLRIIPVAVLLLQFQTLTDAANNLPQLPGNRLAEGPDRELPNAHVIECGRTTVNTGKVTKTRSISQTMSYFSGYAFTAGPIGSQRPTFTNNMGKFSFAEVKGKKYVYALQADRSGEDAYWLPQGGHIDIPSNPSSSQPKYVFTPDFSGCSWTVTPLSNGNLRLRHVEGGREASQFNNLSQGDKGGSTTYAMQYKDYGYLVETSRLVGNIPAFAYMHYTGGRWTLIFQRKTCATTTGGYQFQNELLKSTTNVDSNSSYKPVTGTKTYNIP